MVWSTAAVLNSQAVTRGEKATHADGPLLGMRSLGGEPRAIASPGRGGGGQRELPPGSSLAAQSWLRRWRKDPAPLGVGAGDVARGPTVGVLAITCAEGTAAEGGLPSPAAVNDVSSGEPGGGPPRRQAGEGGGKQAWGQVSLARAPMWPQKSARGRSAAVLPSWRASGGAELAAGSGAAAAVPPPGGVLPEGHLAAHEMVEWTPARSAALAVQGPVPHPFMTDRRGMPGSAVPGGGNSAPPAQQEPGGTPGAQLFSQNSFAFGFEDLDPSPPLEQPGGRVAAASVKERQVQRPQEAPGGGVPPAHQLPLEAGAALGFAVPARASSHRGGYHSSFGRRGKDPVLHSAPGEKREDLFMSGMEGPAGAVPGQDVSERGGGTMRPARAAAPGGRRRLRHTGPLLSPPERPAEHLRFAAHDERGIMGVSARESFHPRQHLPSQRGSHVAATHGGRWRQQGQQPLDGPFEGVPEGPGRPQSRAPPAATAPSVTERDRSPGTPQSPPLSSRFASLWLPSGDAGGGEQAGQMISGLRAGRDRSPGPKNGAHVLRAPPSGTANGLQNGRGPSAKVTAFASSAVLHAKMLRGLQGSEPSQL